MNILWYRKCYYIRRKRFIKGLLIKGDKNILFRSSYVFLDINYDDITTNKVIKIICLVFNSIKMKNNQKYLFIYRTKKKFCF